VICSSCDIWTGCHTSCCVWCGSRVNFSVTTRCGSLDTRLNIPPQVDRGWKDLQLGLQEVEPGSGQPFSKNICKLISSGDKGEQDILIKNLFSDKMVVYLDVLRTSMENRIGSQCKCTYIVTPDHGCDVPHRLGMRMCLYV
jgi:hypothetical protein